jgi:hypothetical protein
MQTRAGSPAVVNLQNGRAMVAPRSGHTLKRVPRASREPVGSDQLQSCASTFWKLFADEASIVGEMARARPQVIESSTGLVGTGARFCGVVGFWQQAMRQREAHLPWQQQGRVAWREAVDRQSPAASKQGGRLPAHRPASRLPTRMCRRVMWLAPMVFLL